jgi:hypothetical protein
MLNHLLHKLQDFSTPRTLTIISVVFVTFIGVFIISPASPAAKLAEYSHGVGMLDAKFHYTPAQAYAMLDAYTEEGRSIYLSQILVIDIAIPIVYSLFFAVLMSSVFRRAFSPDNPIHKLSLLPFAAALLDYTENICEAIMLASFPARLDWVAAISSSFTSVKMIFFGISVASLMVGLVAWLWSIRARRKS